MNRAARHLAAALLMLAARQTVASVPTEAAGARPDQQAFAIITRRNIFDPSRAVLTPPPPPPPRQDFMVLTGTMSFDGQAVAFISGSRPQFRRALKPGDKIAGLTVARIGGDGILLTRDGNQTLALGLNSQLRQLPDGSWSASQVRNTN